MLLVLAWSVLALSIGAIWLLLLLIRHGEVSRASQLIYLVPPTAAAQAYLLFGETLSALQIAGMR
jgi:drug/metabolite transporter (DMT)-like permease